jgi:hypothetical protein
MIEVIEPEVVGNALDRSGEFLAQGLGMAAFGGRDLRPVPALGAEIGKATFFA